MWPHVHKSAEWIAGSVVVDGSVESDRPTWLLRARRGRQWIDLASGPMATRGLAVEIAAVMNDRDPASWDVFVTRELRQRLDGQLID